MKIHVSETTRSMLPQKRYRLVERGKIDVKGKGEMKTYFVLNKIDEDGRDIRMAYMNIMEDSKKNGGLNVPNSNSRPILFSHEGEFFSLSFY